MANWYTEDVLRNALPEGYKSSVNWATGVIKITAPDGTVKKFQNNANYSNAAKIIGSDTVAYTSLLTGKYGEADYKTAGNNAAAQYFYNGATLTAVETFVNATTASPYKYDMLKGSFVDANGNSLGTNNANQAAANAQANAAAAAEAQRNAEEEARRAEEEAARQTIVNNANASNQLIASLLNSGLLGQATSAKQNFTISKEDYAALRAKYPNYSDEQLTNLIANSGWAQNFGAGLSADTTTSDLKGDTLEEFMATAEESNDATKAMTDAVLTQKSKALLKQIENDPELYRAVVKQLRTDAASGVITGQRAANALDVSRENNAAYKASADELYASIGGTGEDSAAGKMRSSIFNNLTGAYGGFTEQQLNTFARDMNLQAEDVKGLITALSLINQGLKSEDAQVRREAADEAARIANEATMRESKASQQSSASIANANAASNDLVNQGSFAGKVAASDVELDADKIAEKTTNKHTNYGTGTYNKPEYEEAPYIDETLYKALLGEDYTKFLDEETFKRFTETKSEADMAKQYGLEDLLNVDNVVNKFTGFQEQANAESDKVFNDAQRAYVMAIAAGDAKTAEQLTRLARTASAGRKNLYGATALANQFAQQHANASVSDDMHYDAIQQQAMNKSAIANATQAGRTQWNQWVGDGNPNASGNGFSQSYNKHVGNTADAKGAYGDLIIGAMGNQSGFNDTVGELNRDSNKTLTNYAAALNNFNAAGAAANTNNSSAVAGIKNNLEVQKLINDATINKYSKK